jgi:iron complex transport system substrate-binding protein
MEFHMRICSLLPSSTEILYALGVGDSVCGVTHECDFPPEVRKKRMVVNSRLPHTTDPAEIDRLVREFTARGESIYAVDAEALREIDPDLIVTQDLCHVCAASPDDLAAALNSLPRMPQIISLNPHSIGDVWKDILTVGVATNSVRVAESLVEELKQRVAAVANAAETEVRNSGRPRVVCLEWLDPPYVGGHWVPEMVEIAGGEDVLGVAGQPSFRVEWNKVIESRADVIVVMPCGFDAEQAAKNLPKVELPGGWETLPAVKENRVFTVDANGYFSRPGPRLAEGVAILARLFHSGIQVALKQSAVTGENR